MNLCARHCSDQLRTVLCNALSLVLAAHNEARQILQEHQGRAPLTAQLNKVRSLDGHVSCGKLAHKIALKSSK